MADNSGSKVPHDVVLNVNGEADSNLNRSASETIEDSGTYLFPFLQKGVERRCEREQENVLTLPGIAIVWGLVIMVLYYSVGHISGAHFNPAVTLAFASTERFPITQVPAYIVTQIVRATLASGTLSLLFTGQHDQFAGTLPAGSYLQAFVVEFVITFYLMFIRFSLATDNREINELVGITSGSTILLNVMFAGPITGASMNPARSLGPALVSHKFVILFQKLTLEIPEADI